MAAVLELWREAATLVIVGKSAAKDVTRVKKELNSHSNSDNHANLLYNYRILMLKRSTKSKFMPNLYVFPGGTAEDTDFSVEWLDFFKNPRDDSLHKWVDFVKRGGEGPYMFSRKRSPEFEHIPSELAFRICAIRETFEESGILLVRNVLDTGTIPSNFTSDIPILGSVSKLDNSIVDSWRRRVVKDPKEFIVMCRELNVVPDIWSLAEWSNWLTPVLAPGGGQRSRRYDTAFFLCVLDDTPVASHDDQETVHAQWCPPDELIRSHIALKGGLAPPQVLELCRLLNYQDAIHLHKFAWKRTKKRVSRWFPVPIICDEGMMLIYPGDELYPENPDFDGTNENILQKVSGTFKEWEQKHPRCYRVQNLIPSSPGQIGTVNCSIEPLDGQVIPVNPLTHLKIYNTHPRL